MLSTTELVTLIGCDYAWFESKRRRERDRLDMSKPIAPGAEFPKINPDDLDLPVKDIFGGRWAKYDAEDAVKMAVAVEGERRGLTFKAAAKLAENAGAVSVLARDPHEPDFWIAKFVDGDGCTHHAADSWEKINQRIAEEKVVDGVFGINVSLVLRSLKTRATDLGLTEALGW